MKRLSVFILVAALALLGWALPAGAEKVRMTDDQMDSVSAGLTVPGFPVDKSYDFARHNDFPQLFGITGDATAGMFVQAPCKTAPSLLCIGSMGSIGAMLGPFGANLAGFETMYLGNATGNHIIQTNGAGMFTHFP